MTTYKSIWAGKNKEEFEASSIEEAKYKAALIKLFRGIEVKLFDADDNLLATSPASADDRNPQWVDA